MAKTEFTVDRDKLQVRMTRVYQATPQRLWAACTDPEQIKQWWGPAKYETVIAEFDFRVGGKWRFVHVDGEERHVFYGEYKEIEEFKKTVNTFEYEPWAGHVLVETATYEDQGNGSTRLTTISQFENSQDLEGMIGSGMESGAVEGSERLAKLVETA